MKHNKWCSECLNAQWCRYINPYIGFYCPGYEEVINNKRPLKEPLAADLIAENYDGFVSKDYKDVLNEITDRLNSGEADAKLAVDSINLIQPDGTYNDQRLKALICLRLFGFSRRIIMQLLRMGMGTYYTMLEEATKRINEARNK